jgi:hypothetical protein
VDTVTSPDELREAARLALDCAVMGQAMALARWIGSGRRQVTSGQVLRKTDALAAGAALGVDVPPKLRTMADVPALHRPWCVAVGTGLLRVSGGWVTVGPALAAWPPGDAELLAGWLAGLRAVCAAESYPQDEDSVRLLVLALLAVLGEQGPRFPRGLWPAVHDALDELCDECDMDEWQVRHAAYRYDDATAGKPRFVLSGLEGLVRLLAGFGAVTGGAGKPVLTPLGRWAAGNLRDGLPVLADPSQTAAELIAEAAQFGDMEQRDHVAGGWLAGRDPTGAAREILAAAEGMPSLLRGVAVGVAELLGDDALPAWQEMAALPHIGPRVREVLAIWDAGPELSEADWRWLGVEAAAAALAGGGPDEALTCVWESMPGADLDERLSAALATGHPDAAELVRAVAEFAASGAPRSVDQVAELKVSLARFRPPVWRRVQLPVTATLGDLHDVIQVLFGWDGDHLHEFRVGKKHYSDSFANLEGAEDEETVRMRDAFAGGGKVGYTYDFGASWEHEVTLEKTLAREAGRKYPVCVAFRADSPVEYWSGDEEDAAEPEPFDLAEVNKRLSAQHHP